MLLCPCPAALVPCWDGLLFWLGQFAQLLPAVLLVGLLVNDALLLLVALLRPPRRVSRAQPYS